MADRIEQTTAEPGKPRGVEDPLLVAVESGRFEANGVHFWIAAGETVLRSGHPLPKARPDLFKPVENPPPDR